MATPTDATRHDAAAEAAPDRAVVLARYYAGETVPCPVGCGDEAESVRVSTAETGEGVIWMECDGCAQRARYTAPSATADERRRVDDLVGEGREPVCPRHDRPTPLRRRGRQLVCPACGVRYRE